ncbi:hypothetical protein PFICI_07967 [Pestalotiopsis fici W106-1]|uniref:Uncharacterized protein n=1 Tax=Pestalotiopsis fici (strain W106-1 / CGMCC3.15140) TaxID=1229662 RepID=W3X2R7_PESFW|nr:uncharacterized protein PFICI_07967 [Pestalotiopsis fici W106-1]ETS80438.1 hypothetical protein PFICI_07967 [Pestalotiopsis fici W106-1]
MCIWRRVHLECTVCGRTAVIEYIDPECNLHEHDPIDEWFVEIICTNCSDRQVLEEEETDSEDGYLMRYANFNAVRRRVDQNQDDYPDWYEPGLLWDSDTEDGVDHLSNFIESQDEDDFIHIDADEGPWNWDFDDQVSVHTRVIEPSELSWDFDTEDGSDHLSNFSERQNEDDFIHIVAEADPGVDHEAPWNSEDYFITDEDETSGWSIDADSSDDEDDRSSDSTVVGDDEESSFESDGSTLVEWSDDEYDADDEQSEGDSSDESDHDSSDDDGDGSDESDEDSSDESDGESSGESEGDSSGDDGDSSDESDEDSSDESSIATVDHNDDGGWVALVDEDFVLSDWIDEAFERFPPHGVTSANYNNGSSSK